MTVLFGIGIIENVKKYLRKRKKNIRDIPDILNFPTNKKKEIPGKFGMNTFIQKTRNPENRLKQKPLNPESASSKTLNINELTEKEKKIFSPRISWLIR